jgi:hypothetical protein
MASRSWLPIIDQFMLMTPLTNLKCFIKPTPQPMNTTRLLLAAFIAILAATSGFADQLNLLPPIPDPGSNPYASNIFDGVKVGDREYKGDFKEQDETPVAALAYLHPNSPYKGKQEILDRLITLLDGRFAYWSSDEKHLEDHISSFEATYSYLLLKTYAPDKIPSDKKAAWESAIKRHTDYLITHDPLIYRDHMVGPTVVNMEIFRTTSVYLGALATDDAASAAIGKAAVEECLTKCGFADGGTHYANYSNEVFIYHHAIVWGGAWYYLFTGSPKMKSFLESLTHYLPISSHYGFGEYSTAPPWKPFYGPSNPETALIIADITGDPYNYELGKDAKPSPLLAFLYKPGLTGKKAPDNFILYDRNILGPHARFGTWGAVGTTRDPSAGAPEVQETFISPTVGISTFIGAYLLKKEGSSDLNAALHGACPEVKIAPGDETDFARGEKWAFLTGAGCHNAVSKSTSLYGLSTRYPINKKSAATDPKGYTGWDGIQEWVFTPDRVIGLSAITCDRSQNAYGLAQRLLLFSHRGTCKPGDGKAQSLVADGPDVWSYGDLRLKAHWNDYGGKPDSFYFGIMNGYGGAKALDDSGTALLTLNDSAVPEGRVTSYPGGTEKHALIEATSKGKSFATDVSVLKLPDGLRGFEFSEPTRKVRMIHNVTGSPLMYGDTMKAPLSQTRILASWDEGDLHPLTSVGGMVTIPKISIPAYAHVLIVNSSKDDDMKPGYLDYAKVFSK